MTQEERRQLVDTLETSRDRDALEKAAVSLAASEDPASLDKLGELLSRADTLARLDDLDDASNNVRHLAEVLQTLQEHPSPSSADVCLRQMREPAFLAVDDRKIYLLPALAAVRPMSEAAANVIRQTNAEAYYNLNVLLLVYNGSPRALALFEEMIRDDDVPEDQRVDGLHAGVLPYRTELAVLQSMDRLVEADLPDEVRHGVIETVFERETGQWFGPQRFPPTPSPWESGTSEALEFALLLAGKVMARGGLPEPLRAAVTDTTAEIREILVARKR
jgi:hypothetical protein